MSGRRSSICSWPSENLALARENAASFERDRQSESDARAKRRPGGSGVASQPDRRAAVAAGRPRRGVEGAFRTPAAGADARTSARRRSAATSRTSTQPARIAESRADLQARRASCATGSPQRRARARRARRRRSDGSSRSAASTGCSAPSIAARSGLAGRGNSLGLFMSTPLPLFDRNQGNIARARDEGQQIDLRAAASSSSAIAADVDVAAAQYASARGDAADGGNRHAHAGA